MWPYLFLAITFFFPGCWMVKTADVSSQPEVALLPSDRLLVLAPHPDDEILGCAGVLQDAVKMNLPVRVVFLTHGDHNQWSFAVYRKHLVLEPRAVEQMGLLRHDEAVAAAHVLAVSTNSLTFLGYPDFGTNQILAEHWGKSAPFKSSLTKQTTVPYSNARRPGAPYKGEEILRDLKDILREFRPTKIFVTHPADENPDHRAAYLFLRVALWDLAKEMNPEIFPYLIHFKFRSWPNPQGLHPDEPLTPPLFFANQIAWRAHGLSPDQVHVKLLALEKHRTQMGYSSKYLTSFVRTNELFGDFPGIRLTADNTSVDISEKKGDLGQQAEQLTEMEQAAFVGFEKRFVGIDKDSLFLEIDWSRPLAKAVRVSVYIFGYRSDRPFGEMPKLHIQLGEFNRSIFNQGTKIPQDGILIVRTPKSVKIRVPLKSLGEPQKIFTSGRSYLETVPLDWLSWRVLEP